MITVLRNRASASAKRLAVALGARCAEALDVRKCKGTRYLINWGVDEGTPNFKQGRLVRSNTPQAVANCRDKIETFRCLNNANVATLEWADAISEAVIGWLDADKKIILRHTVTGHSGTGIQVLRKTGENQAIPHAPLYTRYFKKDAEYRVHVAFGRVILIQQKRKKNGVEHEGDAKLIRTHGNGYIFAVNDLSCDSGGYRELISTLAISACSAVGANHCAVDILVRDGKVFPCGKVRERAAVVCEINSAPALQADTNLNNYVEAFKAWIRSIN